MNNVFLYGRVDRALGAGKEALVEGTLLDVGGHPALRLEGATAVVGRIHPVGEVGLADLDARHGYNKYRNWGPFIRVRVEALPTDRTRGVNCWTYVLVKPVTIGRTATIVEHGDWNEGAALPPPQRVTLPARITSSLTTITNNLTTRSIVRQ